MHPLVFRQDQGSTSMHIILSVMSPMLCKPHCYCLLLRFVVNLTHYLLINSTSLTASNRPLSEEERRTGTPVVITCNDQRREVSVAQNIANKQIDRTFVFDKVTANSTCYSCKLSPCPSFTSRSWFPTYDISLISS